jgi:CheY-like chemotaxis protein
MRKWILLVDDDLDIHFLYRKVFERMGMADSIKLFENGAEVLDFLRSSAGEVKLIFSDVNMPVMDGLQLRKAINNDDIHDLKSIPFVFLSTSARDEEVRAAYDLMVQGFFEKGLTLADIENSFRSVLEYWETCTWPAPANPCLSLNG